MRYPQAATPPVQEGRLAAGHAAPQRTAKTLQPIAPTPSRMEQRPAVVNQWGHMSLAGNDGDRNVVPLPAEDAGGSLLSSPVACAALGFLAFKLLAGR